ncbi:TetR/AcrR family transcriptional regulator [Caulobacter sp. RHG1]|uniref:TetR/AcrR family transcriptional regulator n=1 Tax=Caulobacter sp. (strain RHG1) TaxID=2545762 RepID=UPI0015543522|nr:TetR/AcrR family transcriptional regulator [Caulobacter sp. RHG1]NQE60334.1 Transcriptional regulator, AcrR family [Caulobacter sp. RHG1]
MNSAAKVPTPRGRPGQPKPRVDKAARGQAVLDAAVEVFAEKGLQVATMQDVANRLGVAKILIYRLYPSRQSLIDALFGQVLAQLEASGDQPWGGYGSSIARLIEMSRAHPKLGLLLLRDARGAPEAAAWREALEALLTQLIEPFVAPPPNASEAVRATCRHAARTFMPFVIEAWAAGLEGSDGMNDETRTRWFGEIVKAWREATYRALDLEPATLPPPRAS